MNYRVYYDDGTVSDDEVTQPFRIITVAQPKYETGREVLNGFPYYYRLSGAWYGAEDQTSLIQQMCFNAHAISHVCMGIVTDADNYKAIIKRAIEEEGLPRRSARHRDRRR